MAMRITPDFTLMRLKPWLRGAQRVVGVDEVGRGPLAGPGDGLRRAAGSRNAFQRGCRIPSC